MSGGLSAAHCEHGHYRGQGCNICNPLILAAELARCKIARDGFTKASDEAFAQVIELEVRVDALEAALRGIATNTLNQGSTDERRNEGIKIGLAMAADMARRALESTHPASAQISTEQEEPLLHSDGSLHQFMPWVDGKSFRCGCGGNVFHKPNRLDDNLFQCNSCGERYHSEPS